MKKRLAIKTLGTALHEGDDMADSVALATGAIRSCLKELTGSQHEIDLLVNTGVYRNDFIGEPAMAALIAGQVQLNATIDSWDQSRTFAYDLGNGACGFLHGCWSIQAMVFSGKSKKALCVSSEIENNRMNAPHKTLGLKESGCAVLLEESDRTGFLRFLFKYYPEYSGALRTEINWNQNGQPFLHISRNDDMERLLLQHLPAVVEELLAKENLTMDNIQIVIPPQISSDFVHQFTQLLNIPESKVVNLNEDQNLYTCSTVFGIQEAYRKGMIREGDKGIILEAWIGADAFCRPLSILKKTE